MLEDFLRRLGSIVPRNPAQGAQRSEEQLWEWLDNHPRLARKEVQQLRAWYRAACSNRRVPLTRLHNLIVRTERQLAE
jgi:hypothetical protein